MNDVKIKFAAYVGWDWANKKHGVCAQVGDNAKRSFEVISHLPESIDTWLKELHLKSKGNIAVAVIDAAFALTKDQSVILPHKLLVDALCKQMLTLVHNNRVYDKQIDTLFKNMPDAELFASLPGTGPCLAPRLLAA